MPSAASVSEGIFRERRVFEPLPFSVNLTTGWPRKICGLIVHSFFQRSGPPFRNAVVVPLSLLALGGGFRFSAGEDSGFNRRMANPASLIERTMGLRISNWLLPHSGRPLDVVHVLIIFLANVLHELFARYEAGGKSQLEGPGIIARIVDGDFVDQGTEVFSSPALGGVQLLRVRVSAEIEPKFVVESDRIDYQRVAFPVSDGVPVPGRIDILGMLAAVHEDLPVAMDVSFKQEEDVRWSLHDPPGVGGDTRHTRRQAVRLGIVLRLSCLHDLFRFG